MHGWIIVDKPLGLGSTQVVSAVKRSLRQGGYGKFKVGHGGTLDPLATGVLPVAVGEATKGVQNSGVNFMPLPDGGVVSVTILRAFGPDGAPLPERITPDVTAPTDLDLLTTAGRDSTLEAALLRLRGAQGLHPAER